MSKKLPQNLTSYDLLKAAAVVIMIVDHAGFYFFPEVPMFRAIGRIGFPVWFFLVGHASGRGIPPRLWGGALILLVANYMTGISMFPLNALFTIIFIRLFLDRIAYICFRGAEILLGVTCILCALIIPSFFVTEYGTQALITALFGLVVRRQTAVASYDHRWTRIFMAAATFLSFVIIQQIWFQFDLFPLAVMVAGTLLFVTLLYRFEARTYPELTNNCPFFLRFIIQGMGRRTLEIYVIHLVLFKFGALLMGAGGYSFMDFHWFPHIGN